MTPTFQFFEDVCSELFYTNEAVLPEDSFLTSTDSHGNRNEDLLRDLQDEYKELDPRSAVPRALVALDEHFKARGSELPFTYDLPTRSYRIKDKKFIEFVANVSGMRGKKEKSRAFELAAAERLSRRGLGNFHRTGWPRSKEKKVKEFNKYLHPLGFNDHVLFGKEKDGGFDILWVLPLGAIPRRPIVSFQCKNGSYDFKEAAASNETSRMSLDCHRGLQVDVHTLCVVFNDYIDEPMLSPKRFTFVPLGLTDLSEPLVPLKTLHIL